MSVDPRDRKKHLNTSNSDLLSPKLTHQVSSLSGLIDNIHLSNLNTYYTKEESLFKKRIDKLNLKFYMETEKYLNNKLDIGKCQDQLFIILFKQISLYIEEIERLNKLLKNKIDNKEEDQNNFLLSPQKNSNPQNSQATIKNLKSTINNLDKKIIEYKINEEKMKKEILSLNRQLSFHNEKLQFDITMKRAEEMKKKTVKYLSKPKLTVTGTLEDGQSSKTTNNSFNNHTQNNSRDITNDEVSISSTKKINTTKKRNYSDNTPGALNQSMTSISSSTTMFKKRYDKDILPEVNNININLNVHLKNSNNANINLNTSSIKESLLGSSEGKRELTKSVNMPHNSAVNKAKNVDYMKSPMRTKSTLNENTVKGKLSGNEVKGVHCFINFLLFLIFLLKFRFI
jgi:hypothetical protein